MLGLNKHHSNIKYSIASVLDGYEHTGEVFVQVQIPENGNMFVKSVRSLFKSEWLNSFSTEDAQYITSLATSETKKQLNQVTKIPRKNGIATGNTLLLAAFFISTLIASNIACFKISEFDFSNWFLIGQFFSSPTKFDTGILFVPLTFCACDILTEVYGFKVSRQVIYSGMVALAIATACINLSIWLPAAPEFAHQNAYSSVLGSSWKFLIAALAAFFCGEYINASILSVMKTWSKGKLMWLRFVTSTFMGTVLDGLIFYIIAYQGTYSTKMIISLIIFQSIFRITAELILLPFTLQISSYLKKKDNMDAYDHTNLSFNPFSNH